MPTTMCGAVQSFTMRPPPTPFRRSLRNDRANPTGCYLKIGRRVAYRLCDVEAFEAAHIRTISGSTGERRPAA
jgi:hypothetical protein